MRSTLKDLKSDRRSAASDDGIEGKFSQRFYNVPISCIGLKPSDKVLDAGCGAGYLLQRTGAQHQIRNRY